MEKAGISGGHSLTLKVDGKRRISKKKKQTHTHTQAVVVLLVVGGF
jgi:hypothetical protein